MCRNDEDDEPAEDDGDPLGLPRGCWSGLLITVLIGSVVYVVVSMVHFLLTHPLPR